MESLVVIISTVLVNFHYDTPQMDEIFHLRQLETYLRGDFFKWDEKITTLPGLYLFSWIFLTLIPIHKLFSLLKICRLLNSVLLVSSSLILGQLSSGPLIVLYPPLFMASCLFYTDTISLISTLLACYLIERHKIKLSFAISAFSVLCRQTNIVWIGYFVGLQIINDYKVKTLRDLFEVIKRSIGKIVYTYLPLLFLAATFVGFVVVNKGIAVGDRSNHQPGLHIAQLCYLVGITAIYVPIDLDKAKKVLLQGNWVFFIPIVGIVLLKFVYVHDFILADNTHYVFYIWKRILSPYGIYLSPVYAFCLCYLKGNADIKYIWWLICSAIVLIPSTLLELRYFIMPIFGYQLLSPSSHSRFRRFLLVSVNILTILIFTKRPYNNIAFMW